ncbi:MAG: helix-turn-helix transcriptional regulator [Ruminococcaceae bacterium]|nr:helix-turn-helix transcriptional regulator [Oscillospiraceae bacterium]
MAYEYDKVVGNQIKMIRESKGLTQDQLSAKLQINGCDITRSALAKIEAGQRHIYLVELKMICFVLQCDYNDVMI